MRNEMFFNDLLTVLGRSSYNLILNGRQELQLSQMPRCDVRGPVPSIMQKDKFMRLNKGIFYIYIKNLIRDAEMQFNSSVI